MNGSGERLACVVSCVGIAMLFFPLIGFYHAIQVGNFLALYVPCFLENKCLMNDFLILEIILYSSRFSYIKISSLLFIRVTNLISIFFPLVDCHDLLISWYSNFGWFHD